MRIRVRIKVMVYCATSNNISVISFQCYWGRKPECLEKTGVSGENHRPVEDTDKLYHIMLCRVQSARAGFELTTSEVIDTDGKSSCKSNYHTITTTTASHNYDLSCLISALWSITVFL